jgi:peptidoglycan hydrolase-like protein with peptidoglycan-binding domain
MTSVRHSPLRGAPVQAHHGRPATPRAAEAQKAVDGFERKLAVPTLQRGMTGSAVTALQQKLVAARFMTNEDFRSGPGVYGPRTEAAVKRLQQSVGLPITGVAGASTMAALASGARYQPAPVVARPAPQVLARLSETFTEEVTQPMGMPTL